MNSVALRANAHDRRMELENSLKVIKIEHVINLYFKLKNCTFNRLSRCDTSCMPRHTTCRLHLYFTCWVCASVHLMYSCITVVDFGIMLPATNEFFRLIPNETTETWIEFTWIDKILIPNDWVCCRLSRVYTKSDGMAKRKFNILLTHTRTHTTKPHTTSYIVAYNVLCRPNANDMRPTNGWRIKKSLISMSSDKWSHGSALRSRTEHDAAHMLKLMCVNDKLKWWNLSVNFYGRQRPESQRKMSSRNWPHDSRKKSPMPSLTSMRVHSDPHIQCHLSDDKV